MSVDKYDKIIDKYDSLKSDLDSISYNDKNYSTVAKQVAELEGVILKINSYRDVCNVIAELELDMKVSAFDKEMIDLIKEEIFSSKTVLTSISAEIDEMLKEEDPNINKSAIMEIRAGTGGLEAALFSASLLRMYSKYADIHGWIFDIMDISENELGGVKEVTIFIKGSGAFRKLQYECGVHRVQRIPQTETNGRIHTSTSTVAVLPEAEKVDIEIEEKDLRIDVMRASGAGGQHVNKTESAVRITHIPSGIAVMQQSERSQHMNRERAMKILASKLFDLKNRAVQEARSNNRKDQIGSGDRSEKIRTYNFPQNRVTDHRIGFTLHKIEAVLEGLALDEIIDEIEKRKNLQQELF